MAAGLKALLLLRQLLLNKAAKTSSKQRLHHVINKTAAARVLTNTTRLIDLFGQNSLLLMDALRWRSTVENVKTMWRR